MAILSTLLAQRYQSVDVSGVPESNLEQGEIAVFTASDRNIFQCGFRYEVPRSGQLVIEAWGAGGSGSRMCCCGMGLPGNSGSYAKKTISVSAGGFVCGNVGQSCSGTDLCFRGCSEATCITICGAPVAGQCSCICTQGGHAGLSICFTGGTGNYCCFLAQGFCGTNTGSGCGIICNCHTTGNANQAYGGDINIPSLLGCMYFYTCNPCCHCSIIAYIPFPAGTFSTCGGHVAVSAERDNERVGATGWWGPPTSLAFNDLSRSGAGGGWWTTCWSGNFKSCMCYDEQGCTNLFPYGVGGPPADFANEVRNNGWRGGPGAVRIKFIG